ncbi:MAG: PIG-L family deacetylase [Anaerolineales bacterium]|nr:PIG-L family deacetylase [Anaerolineales bacterium]
MSSNETPGRKLLAVFAHPDDESFGPGGTLALYAKQGVAVHLICATRGEVGETPADLGERTDENIARLREDELRCAARALKLEEVHFLDYRDSGMPGADTNRHPRALASAPVEQVADKIAVLMRRIQPQVVITFDPIGGYRHPDHVAIHDATARAFHDVLARPGTHNSPPQKLYYHTFPKRLMRLMVRLMPLFGQNPREFGINKDIDLTEIASVNYPIHANIQVRSVMSEKAEASACHASQHAGGSGGILGFALRFFGTKEPFMRAYPPAPDSLHERDLFEGLS